MHHYSAQRERHRALRPSDDGQLIVIAFQLPRRDGSPQRNLKFVVSKILI